MGFKGGMLYVRTQSLEELAGNQDDASGSFEKATSATDKVMHDLRVTHGAISVAFIHEVDSALAERTAAGDALKSASALAAAALRAAKSRYDSTDKESGEILDKEVRDR